MTSFTTSLSFETFVNRAYSKCPLWERAKGFTNKVSFSVLGILSNVLA